MHLQMQKRSAIHSLGSSSSNSHYDITPRPLVWIRNITRHGRVSEKRAMQVNDSQIPTTTHLSNRHCLFGPNVLRRTRTLWLIFRLTCLRRIRHSKSNAKKASKLPDRLRIDRWRTLDSRLVIKSRISRTIRYFGLELWSSSCVSKEMSKVVYVFFSVHLRTVINIAVFFLQAWALLHASKVQKILSYVINSR